MKKLLPVLMLLLGVGGGVAAGMVLKPAPVEEHAAACGPADPHGAPAADATSHAAETPGAPCPEAAEDPFAAPAAEKKPEGELVYVAMEKPFVVPIFSGDKTVGMMVVALSVESDVEGAHVVEAVQPRLRDSFLKVMFRHANSGGFDGSFTTGQKIEDLKAALLAAARAVMGEAPVGEVLITEIARQDS